MTQHTRGLNLKHDLSKRSCALALALGLLAGGLFGNTAAAAPPQLQACGMLSQCSTAQALDLTELRQLRMARIMAAPGHPGFTWPRTAGVVRP